MLGFCEPDEKPLGPVQLQLVALVAPPNKFKVPPTHTGVFDEAETPVGTEAEDVPIYAVAVYVSPQPITIVTVYVTPPVRPVAVWVVCPPGLHEYVVPAGIPPPQKLRLAVAEPLLKPQVVFVMLDTVEATVEIPFVNSSTKPLPVA